MTREFIVRRSDIEGEWFSLRSSDFDEVLVAKDAVVRRESGDSAYRLTVADSELLFYHDDPGIHVVCNGTIGPCTGFLAKFWKISNPKRGRRVA